MNKFLLASVAAFGLATVGTTAQAQTALSGDELRGHTVDVVFSDGTRNAVYFAPNGSATITSPDGMRSAGTWAVQGNRLCLSAGGGNECWTYARRFAAGQTQTLTSSCNSTSQWTARSVNPMQEVAPPMVTGERG